MVMEVTPTGCSLGVGERRVAGRHVGLALGVDVLEDGLWQYVSQGDGENTTRDHSNAGLETHRKAVEEEGGAVESV
jgi:hypothetical protein